MSAKKKLLPVPPEFSFEHEGGSLTYSKYTSKAAVQGAVIEVEPLTFPVCPICLQPDPDVPEHIPPQSLGGRIMTMTCRRCNHDFGTAENELRSFIDLEATVRVKASDGSVMGHRPAKVALRSSEGRATGAFVRSAAPGFNEALRSGSSELTFRPPDKALVMAAGLKHAYLAACLHQRAVPESDDVNRVQAILLAIRDRDRVALMDALVKLGFEPVPRWIEAANVPPILLRLATEEDDPHWQFVFAGRFILPWPFADVQPRGVGG